jgi:hypothetical protein
VASVTAAATARARRSMGTIGEFYFFYRGGHDWIFFCGNDDNLSVARVPEGLGA